MRVLHQVRWTADKIARRIALVEPLVYRRRRDLVPFRYRPLSGPAEDPQVELRPDYVEDWPTIEANAYWGEWRRDFVLYGDFEVPSDWDPGAPVALRRR